MILQIDMRLSLRTYLTSNTMNRIKGNSDNEYSGRFRNKKAFQSKANRPISSRSLYGDVQVNKFENVWGIPRVLRGAVVRSWGFPQVNKFSQVQVVFTWGLVPLWTERQGWKYYLTATLLAGGKRRLISVQLVITAHKRSFGKVMFLHMSVSH